MATPAPNQPSSVQVLRRKSNGADWVDEWVDLSTDTSLNRIDVGTDRALRIRAKIAAEFYEEGLTSSICRRLVIWTIQDGSSDWVRYPERNWWEGQRWHCVAEESGYQEFSISLPISTHHQIRVAVENYEILTNANGQKYRTVGTSSEGSVWSSRYPVAAPVLAPAITVPDTGTVDLTWRIEDEDEDSAQSAYGIQVRRAAFGDMPPGDVIEFETGAVVDFMDESETGTYPLDLTQFPPNLYYEWRVAVKDYSLWSQWSSWRNFYIVGTEQTPLPISPSNNQSVDVTLPVTFYWDFRDLDDTGVQQLANLRYRAVGAIPWTTLSGDVTTPGAEEFWEIDALTFTPGVQYEWQVQTQSSSVSGLSDWSASAKFWTSPGAAVLGPDQPLFTTLSQGSLGCGTYRVFVYDRGGMTRRGEITPLESLQWDRRRDDISQADLRTNGFGADCAALLRTVHCWMHEIVIFRDGVRVWEGPITRITETVDGVEIAAHDPMVYVYRRILRQGYNDAFPRLQTVVFRSTRIIQDALAYDDPNVLGYLTPISNTGDARESRVVSPWSKSAWEEVDDLAANAGLDYTTVGRRIILWDVHQEIGRLPEMRNGDFSDPVVVTEYGMLAANVFAVTNNAGVYSYVQQFSTDPGPYGHIEQIASSYGESEGAATETLTGQALADLQNVLKGQAQRNISGRYPAPTIVRVPDNTSILPHVEIGINQLVPGVRIPLRSVGALREITQLQRLDKVTVSTNAREQEKIRVVMSPAPGADVESEPEAPPS